MRPPARGIVVLESLRDGRPPHRLEALEARRYEHTIGCNPVHLIELQVPEELVSIVALDLAKVLRAPGYYGHLVEVEVITVTFPQMVALVERGDSASAQRCRAVGRLFGIPDDQMRFEEMFDEDHPDAG